MGDNEYENKWEKEKAENGGDVDKGKKEKETKKVKESRR